MVGQFFKKILHTYIYLTVFQEYNEFTFGCCMPKYPKTEHNRKKVNQAEHNVKIRYRYILNLLSFLCGND